MRLSPAHAFESEHRSKHLAHKVVRGGATTLVSQFVRTGVQMVGTIVLARLLTPSDYGLVGMAAVLIGLAQMFKDAGLATATVQQESISRDQISTLFWLNLLISALIGACVLAASPFVAAFYGRPELAPVTAALSASFLLGGFTIQHEALLRRHMMFGSLGVLQVISQAANVISAIAAAALGLGYWALVIGTLSMSAARALVALLYCPWIPGRPRRRCGTMRMIRFGGDVMGFNFVNYFARNGDNILIGRFIGADALGLYAKAYQLFMLPITQIRNPLDSVALPAMSALKNDPRRYAAFYVRMVELMAILTVPVAAYCIVDAEFIIRVLLGEQWSGAVPVFRILALAGLVQAVTSTIGMVLVSSGQSRRYLYLGIANAAVLVTSFAVGVPYGIEGVATAYTVAGFVLLLPSLRYAFRDTSIRVADFFRALARPLITGFLSGTIAVGCRVVFETYGDIASILGLLVFTAVYVGVSASSRHVRDSMAMLVRHARKPASTVAGEGLAQ